MSINEPHKDTVTEAVPSVWPGAFKVYAASKEAMMYNIKTVVWLIVLSFVVSIAANVVSPNQFYATDTTVASTSSASGMLINIVSQLLSILLSAAMIYAIIAGVKRQKMSLNESLEAGLKKFLPIIGQSLLLGLIALGSILLFIVPVFFIMPRLALAQYYLLEGNMGVTDSITASWRATKGNVGKVWGIIGVNLLIALLCITIIGIPFAVYFGIMYSAAEVILYFWLKGRKATESSSPIIEQR